MVPVHCDDWELLGMSWKGAFYVDTCLPFGLRSAPYLFNQFATALRWILANNYNVLTVHYLDDYFLARPASSPTCRAHMLLMLDVCRKLGIPIAADKLEGPATIITFLGIELDSRRQEIRLPPAKLHELMQELERWLAVHAPQCVTKRELLHHHLRLNSEAKEDLAWWHTYLLTWNGSPKVLEPSWTAAQDLELYTDASGSWGFGACFRGSWLSQPWAPHQLTRSIQWKELFAIVVAAATWAPKLTCRRVRFNCDNLAVVQAWQNQSAKDRPLLALLRKLFFIAAQHNFTSSFAHVPGTSNAMADALSRNCITTVFSLSLQAEPNPTRPPPELLEL